MVISALYSDYLRYPCTYTSYVLLAIKHTQAEHSEQSVDDGIGSRIAALTEVHSVSAPSVCVCIVCRARSDLIFKVTTRLVLHSVPTSHGRRMLRLRLGSQTHTKTARMEYGNVHKVLQEAFD